MSDVIWYRLSERAPTEADADERGRVMWCVPGESPVGTRWDTSWEFPDKWWWRRLIPADYPPKPKPREPRKVVRWVWWPPNGEAEVLHWIDEADAYRYARAHDGHIQRVEIVEELPEGER